MIESIGCPSVRIDHQNNKDHQNNTGIFLNEKDNNNINSNNINSMMMKRSKKSI
jgi:hypothetical protein